MPIKILQCAPGDCTNIDFLTVPLLKKFFENNSEKKWKCEI